MLPHCYIDSAAKEIGYDLNVFAEVSRVKYAHISDDHILV